MYTLELFTQLFPQTPTATLEQFVDPLNETAARYYIDLTPQRAAAFIAQTGHESGNLRAIQENLNYSAQGLLKIFPKYFNEQTANAYARKPQMIASRVYGSRMGNGPEETGDGWTYRGRGLIQLTGFNNYSRMAESFGMDVAECAQYLETIEGACLSAGWFWDSNKLNDIVDRDDFILLTKRINGGTIGLEHRQHLYHAALQLLE